MVGITYGGLAQLARALALHARGHRFESDILHTKKREIKMRGLVFSHRDKGNISCKDLSRARAQ